MSQAGNQHFIDQLRKDSGQIKSRDPFVNFMYTLMRDHLPAGTVEALVQDTQLGKEKECLFTNGWLAEYANDLVDRIDDTRLLETNRKLKDCVELMHSIMNNGTMVIETPNEGALMKAMELVGYPITTEACHRDIDCDYDLFLENNKSRR